MGSVSEKNKPSMAGGGRKMSTVDPLNDDHMSADSDVDDDDEESEGGEDGGEGADRDSPSDEAGPDKRGQLLTEYVINVVSTRFSYCCSLCYFMRISVEADL